MGFGRVRGEGRGRGGEGKESVERINKLKTSG